MKRVRKMTALCLALILLMMSLSACGGKDDDYRDGREEDDKKATSTPTEKPDDPTPTDTPTVTSSDTPAVTPVQEKKKIVLWCNSLESDSTRHGYEMAASQMRKLYPDVEFEWEAYELATYKQIVKYAANGDYLPDIFYIWSGVDLEKFALQDKVYCLDSVYGDFASDLPEVMCRNFTYDGHLYGIPLNYNLAVLYANMDMLKQVGYTEIPGTYEELTACCDKLIASGRYPFVCGGGEKWCISEYLESIMLKNMGPEALDRIFTGKATWDNSQVEESAGLFLEMIYRRYFSPDSLMFFNDEAKDHFLNGEYAFYLNGSWFCWQISNAQFDVTIGEFPVINSDRATPGMLIGGPASALAVSKNTEDPEFTAEFAMKFSQLVSQYCYLDEAGLPAWNINYDDSKVNPLYRSAASMGRFSNAMVLFGDCRMKEDDAVQYLEAIAGLRNGMIDETGFVKELAKKIR